jgi:hypothetical protein
MLRLLMLQEELFSQQEAKLLSQLKVSHERQKVAAEQVTELQDALKTAAETVKDCHKTNIALVTEKKVCPSPSLLTAGIIPY